VWPPSRGAAARPFDLGERTEVDGSKRHTIVDAFQADSPVGTEFLRLFHGLVRGTNAGEPKVYLITSATVGEGKSTAASFLSLTMATLKRKTLLLDADLRRPAIHRLFDLSLEDGVTDVADGQLPLTKAYKETPVPHLTVLTAGRLSKDPSSYFEGGHVQKIVLESKPRFDFIVIDCAPVMPVVDPMLLVGSVTSTLLLVKAGATHRELVKQASELLKKAHAPLAGILLNDVKEVLPSHYGHRYAYQYYRPTERK
jgi:capsular exopolysaccharide synthesis family protein